MPCKSLHSLNGTIKSRSVRVALWRLFAPRSWLISLIVIKRNKQCKCAMCLIGNTAKRNTIVGEREKESCGRTGKKSRSAKYAEHLAHEFMYLRLACASSKREREMCSLQITVCFSRLFCSYVCSRFFCFYIVRLASTETFRSKLFDNLFSRLFSLSIPYSALNLSHFQALMFVICILFLYLYVCIFSALRSFCSRSCSREHIWPTLC